MVSYFFSCAGTSHNIGDSYYQNSEVLMKIVKLGKNNQEIEVRKKEVLTGSDKYAIRISSEISAYVYIYQIDPKENITRLFPKQKYSHKKNPIKANVAFRIPFEGEWFALDDNTGREDIILLAHKKPLDDPEKICKQILKDSRGDVGRGDPPPDCDIKLEFNFNHQ